MKNFLLIVSVLAINLSLASAEQIKGVTICAAECNSESLGVYPVGQALVGTIYYAKATPETTRATGVCLSQSSKVSVVSNRMTDESSLACVDALLGKYFGKVVDIDTETQRSEEDSDLGTYFSIKTK